MRRSVFVTPERLAAELRWKNPPLLLDVRWTLAEPNGYPAYQASRIPGARYVDLEKDLSAAPGEMTGRHPLPDLRRLQRTARGWGLDDGRAVVVYDDADGAAAARAWWVLRWAGAGDVRILDGGFRAWSGHGTLVFGWPNRPEKAPRRGNVTLSGGHLPTISAEEAGAFPGVLLDARAAERYRGEFEPLDPRAGHIPGAVSATYTGNLTPEGGFLPAEALRARFQALGALDATPVAAYCGSGVTAAHNIAALASLGVEAALYPGSWSQWSADPARPVAVGA